MNEVQDYIKDWLVTICKISSNKLKHYLTFISVPVLLHLYQGCFYWEIETQNNNNNIDELWLCVFYDLSPSSYAYHDNKHRQCSTPPHRLPIHNIYIFRAKKKAILRTQSQLIDARICIYSTSTMTMQWISCSLTHYYCQKYYDQTINKAIICYKRGK